MIKVNIWEMKARLSEYLDRIERGERVVICRRNQPVAELRPISTARTDPRPIGGAKGQLEIPDTFFEPLPEAIVESFWGDSAASAPRQEKPNEFWMAREVSSRRSPKPRAKRRRPPQS